MVSYSMYRSIQSLHWITCRSLVAFSGCWANRCCVECDECGMYYAYDKPRL